MEDAEILGITTVRSAGRKTEEKESKGLMAAKRTLAQLRVLPLARKEKLAMARTVGLSKATYGWVGRSPTGKEAHQVTSEVWNVASRDKASNAALRNVLAGGTLNLEAVVGCQRIGSRMG